MVKLKVVYLIIHIFICFFLIYGFVCLYFIFSCLQLVDCFDERFFFYIFFIDLIYLYSMYSECSEREKERRKKSYINVDYCKCFDVLIGTAECVSSREI